MSCAPIGGPSFSDSWTAGSTCQHGLSGTRYGGASVYRSSCGALHGGRDAAAAGGARAPRMSRRRRPGSRRRVSKNSRRKSPRQCARDRHPRGDVPDDRIGGAGERPAAGVFRARDLAGKPLSVRCGRTAHAPRPARAGYRAIHAGNRQRAAVARSLRSRAGAAEIRGVPQRIAQPVRQSRACGGRLQCRPAAGAGMARRHRRDAAGDAQLRQRHHRQPRSRTGPRPAAAAKCPTARRIRVAAN